MACRRFPKPRDSLPSSIVLGRSRRALDEGSAAAPNLPWAKEGPRRARPCLPFGTRFAADPPLAPEPSEAAERGRKNPYTVSHRSAFLPPVALARKKHRCPRTTGTCRRCRSKPGTGRVGAFKTRGDTDGQTRCVVRFKTKLTRALPMRERNETGTRRPGETARRHQTTLGDPRRSAFRSPLSSICRFFGQGRPLAARDVCRRFDQNLRRPGGVARGDVQVRHGAYLVGPDGQHQQAPLLQRRHQR